MHSFAALLFPSTCRLCHHGLLLTASRTPLCRHCTENLRRAAMVHSCSVCAEPGGYEPDFRERADGGLCEACAADTPPFVRSTSFGSYELMRAPIRLFKFEAVRSLARPMGPLLADAILSHGEAMPKTCTLVPVPVFGRRRRAYNQSLLLAREALPHVRRQRPDWKITLAPRALKRVHQKRRHYRLSPEERRENVRGAFRVRGDVTGQHILLVDDVYTTGATVRECTEMLLAAGAASVRVSTLARAGGPLPEPWSPSVATFAHPAGGAPAPA